jgi:hypothetical protein
MKGKLMKKIILILGALFLVAPAIAVDRLVETVHGPDTAPTVMNLDGALLASEGDSAAGATIGIAQRLNAATPLYIGAELGLFLTTGYSTYTIAPLLGQAYYQLELKSVIHPLIGFMAGPVISSGGTDSTLQLGAFFRPGINFELGKSAVLNLESRLGVIGSNFVLMPQVGVIFPI